MLLLASGRNGLAPLIGRTAGDPDQYADPLPQAMALTTIVITFGVTALLLAMAYRSWLLDRDDDVPDDITDRDVARGGWRDQEVDDEVADEQADADATRSRTHDGAWSRCRWCCRSSAPGCRSCSGGGARRSGSIGLAILTATTVISFVLLIGADRDGPLVVHAGGVAGTGGDHPRRRPLSAGSCSPSPR